MSATTAVKSAAGALALLAAASAHAACPASPDDLARDAAAAVGAFAGLDLTGFQVARDGVAEAVGCLDAPPSPTQAADVHLVFALDAYGRRDADGNRDEVAGIAAFVARRAAGGGAPPASVAPPGGGVEGWWRRAAEAPDLGATAVILPDGYALVVDGVRVPVRPLGRPALLVITAPDGAVWWSGLLGPDDALPTPPAVAQASLVPKTDDASRGGMRRAWPAFAGAGAAAAAAGGLWVAALSGRGEVLAIAEGVADNQTEADLGTTYDEASARYNQTVGLGYAAQAVTGVAVGLGVVGVALAW